MYLRVYTFSCDWKSCENYQFRWRWEIKVASRRGRSRTAWTPVIGSAATLADGMQEKRGRKGHRWTPSKPRARNSPEKVIRYCCRQHWTTLEGFRPAEESIPSSNVTVKRFVPVESTKFAKYADATLSKLTHIEVRLQNHQKVDTRETVLHHVRETILVIPSKVEWCVSNHVIVNFTF